MPSLRELLLQRLTTRADGSRRCNEPLCNKEFSVKSDSGAWKPHFLCAHPSILATLEALADKPRKRTAPDNSVCSHESPPQSSVATSKRPKSVMAQRTLPSMVAAAAFDDERALASIASLFARHSLPYQLVEAEAFRKLLTDVGWASDVAFPARASVRAMIAAQANDMRSRVVAQLRLGPITVAADGWTNVRHEKVTNIILIVNGVAFYWCSIVNTTERNTADWLFTRFKPVLDSLIDEHRCRVVGLVLDNESANRKLAKQLQESFPFLVHSGCAAHTLQLVVRGCLESPTISATVRQLNALLRFFDVKENRQMLRRMQDAQLRPALSVLKPNDTRWSSTLIAAERIKQLQPDVSCCFDVSSLPAIPSKESFFTDLDRLIEFLKPFQVATDCVQADTATLFTVHEQFLSLQKHAKEKGAPHVAVSLLQRWHKYIHTHAVVATAILSFAPLPPYLATQRQEGQTFIISFGSKYLAKYSVECTDEATLSDVLTLQVAEFNGRIGIFSNLDDNIATVQRTRAAHSPSHVWLLYPENELSVVARALLSVGASEAAVERTFSTQAAVHTKRRNRLLGQAVENEMMLRWNSRAFNTDVVAAAAFGSCSEMNQEWTSADDVGLYGQEEMEEIAVTTDEEEEQESALDMQDDDDEEPHVDCEAAASAAAAASSSRRVRRTASVVFTDVAAFVKWFALEYNVLSSSVWNADMRNALQHAASTRLRGSPSTQKLQELVRAHVGASTS
jgi:hypothetical protein